MPDLDRKDIAALKASVPLFRLHGIALAQRLIERLLRDPEIAAMAGPAEDDRRERLALALIAVAENVGGYSEGDPAVAAAARWLAARGARPRHLELAGRALRSAMQDVFMMGDADPLLAAWGRAWAELAHLLIAAGALSQPE